MLTCTLQFVIHECFREKILRLAHDTLMSGHSGIKKTVHRVLNKLLCPGVCGDVSRFCKYCDICQRLFRKVVSLKSL